MTSPSVEPLRRPVAAGHAGPAALAGGVGAGMFVVVVEPGPAPGEPLWVVFVGGWGVPPDDCEPPPVEPEPPPPDEPEPPPPEELVSAVETVSEALVVELDAE